MLLRGINARVEGLFDVTFDDGRTPLEPIPPFDGQDCRFLSEELGMNMLRLPVSWSAIEPERGVVDDRYLDDALALAEDCHEHGIQVLVDLHQDAWSKHIGEDGAPLWAILPAPGQLLEGPLDDLASRRVSPIVLAAFESFWRDVDGIQGAFIDMAAHVARRIDGQPGVIGLELFNEPGVWDVADLDRFHRRAAERLEAETPDLTLFFEPNAARNFLDWIDTGEPFPHADAVYAPHVYTHVFSGPQDGWLGEDPAPLAASMAAASDEADHHGTPLFVGEYGNDPATPWGLRWIGEQLALQDRHLASSALWLYEEHSQDSWGLFEGEGEGRALREDLADLVAHPFPAAVDGQLLATGVEADGSLRVELANAGRGTHRIAAPLRHWPGSLRATCDGEPAAVVREQAAALVRCQGSVLRVTGDHAP